MGWFSSARKNQAKQLKRVATQTRRRKTLIEQLESRQMLSGEPLTSLDGDYLANWETIVSDSIAISSKDSLFKAAEITTSNTVSKPLTTDKEDYYYYYKEQLGLRRAQDMFVVALNPGEESAALFKQLTGELAPFAGYELYTALDQNKFVIKRPAAVDFRDIDESRAKTIPGVNWLSPVFVTESSGLVTIVTDEIFVTLAKGVDPAKFFADGFASWDYFVENTYLAKLAVGGLNALETANRLSINEDVEWSSPNMYSQVQFNTNDPQYNIQWSLNNTGQLGAKNDADADVVEAWNTTTGNSSVVIAVLDSGVQTNHPDLSIFTNSGEIPNNNQDDDQNGFIDDVNGWDFTSTGPGDKDPNPDGITSTDAHGTSVAGIIAAIGNNSTGVTGVSQNSKILPVRIGTATTFVNFPTMAKAIYYAAGAKVGPLGGIVPAWGGADVINCSFTYPENTMVTDANGTAGCPDRS